ncbi:MAG: multiheme c-type cytochrome [Myxococcota bacterium]
MMRRLLYLCLTTLLIAVTSVALGDGVIAGWRQGTPAAGTAEVLTPSAPLPIDLPPTISAAIQGETLLFYYSPTCPHCQQVMPDLNALMDAAPDLDVIGVAVGAASPELVAHFAETYGARFETIIDVDRSFSMMMGARATPNVYMVRPNNAEDADKPFELLEAYTPFARGMGPVLLMRRAPTDPFAHFQGYQGELACRVCHQQEGMSWAITHHAQAYYTLYQRDRAEDLECVGCHVTGLGAPTGFTVGDHRSPLANVTCESCHSASGPHDGESVDANQTCAGCHNKEHAINFSLAKGLPHIDHYAANGMTREQLRDRMSAIADGTAPKPLLAFPEGDAVGAQACRSCHKKQHRTLKKAPHARAMAALAGSDAENVDCVRCHATPARSGPAAEDLSGYLTDEGVGCESCHGPGQAHVQDPSADNIVGLGESCPECVIEAICTSCHTPEWAPNWDLKEALDQIPH